MTDNRKRSSNLDHAAQKRLRVVDEPDSQLDASQNHGNAHNEDGVTMHTYKAGSIVRIKLHNFVTYSDCEFNPGPRLNVVIGPNGTGKSSIVCALALGLAGSTQILGRAKQVGDFVKHGADQGYVEIEVAGERGNNTVIRRDIRKDNSSEWRLNGRHTTKAVIKETVEKLNIQVDNLCQFLPQDKVVNFAGMSAEELLRETEKALGSDELVKQHDDLIQWRKDEKTIQTSFDEHKRHLENLENLQSSVRKDVMRFRERERFLQLVDQLEMKRPWVEFELARSNAEMAKATAEEAQQLLAAYEEEKIKPIRVQIAAAEEKVRRVDQERNEGTNKMKELDRERRNYGDALERVQAEDDQTRRELASLQQRAEDRKRQAERERRELNNLKQEIEKIPNGTEIQAQVKEFNMAMRQKTKEIQEAQTRRVDAEDRLKEAHLSKRQKENRLRELEDIRKQRFEVLRRNHPDALRGYDWVQKNKDSFKEQVFGPLFLDVNIEDPLHARYVEHISPGWLMTAFVTQTSHDRDILSRELTERQHLKVAITNIDSRNQIDWNAQRPAPREELSQYGFVGYLDQVIQAPPVIIDALRSNANIHSVAAGTAKTVGVIGDILEKTPISAFATPDQFYTKRRSAYGNRNVSTRVDPLKRATYFGGVDMKEKERLEEDLRRISATVSQLDQELRVAQEQEKALATEERSMKSERDALVTLDKKRDTLARKISLKEKDLQVLEVEEDTKDEETKYKKQLNTIMARRVKYLTQLRDSTMKTTELQLNLDYVTLRRFEVNSELQTLRNQGMLNDQEHRTLQQKVAIERDNFKMLLATARELKNRANAKTPLTEEVKKIFETLPDTLDEIDAQISDAKTKAEMHYSSNPQVIEQFERREVEINELKQIANEEEATLTAQQEKIADLKARWEGTLEPLVARIDASFRKYFSAIGCAGEVRFAKSEDGDFDKYAIEIWVKFRDEDTMAKLDPHHQSGGERSVSTMLFLISIQELTPCPFRLVDEINQGMDTVNERMIFRVVSEVACRPGVPQYFLITPKLLPDLEFTPEMTILCVYNGPWQVEHKKWNIDRFLSHE